jgi:hypothetical protein
LLLTGSINESKPKGDIMANLLNSLKRLGNGVVATIDVLADVTEKVALTTNNAVKDSGSVVNEVIKTAGNAVKGVKYGAKYINDLSDNISDNINSTEVLSTKHFLKLQTNEGLLNILVKYINEPKSLTAIRINLLAEKDMLIDMQLGLAVTLVSEFLSKEYSTPSEYKEALTKVKEDLEKVDLTYLNQLLGD